MLRDRENERMRKYEKERKRKKKKEREIVKDDWTIITRLAKNIARIATAGIGVVCAVNQKRKDAKLIQATCST